MAKAGHTTWDVASQGTEDYHSGEDCCVHFSRINNNLKLPTFWMMNLPFLKSTQSAGNEELAGIRRDLNPPV